MIGQLRSGQETNPPPLDTRVLGELGREAGLHDRLSACLNAGASIPRSMRSRFLATGYSPRSFSRHRRGSPVVVGVKSPIPK